MEKFKETQSVARNSRALALLVPLLLFLLYGLFYQYFYSTNTEEVKTTLIILTSIPSIVICLSLFLSLTTEIDEQGIYISLKPIFIKRKIKWSEVKNVVVRKFDKLQEFGYASGPGILSGKNGLMGYLIQGDIALVIEMHNDKRVLIGTQKSKSLLQAINKYKK